MGGGGGGTVSFMDPKTRSRRVLVGLWAARWESRGVRCGGAVGRAWRDEDCAGGELIMMFASYLNPPRQEEQLFLCAGRVTSNCTLVD